MRLDGREHPRNRPAGLAVPRIAVRGRRVWRTREGRKDAGARRTRPGHAGAMLARDPARDGLALRQRRGEAMAVKARIFGERFRPAQHHALEMPVAAPPRHCPGPLKPLSSSGRTMPGATGGTLSASSTASFNTSPVHWKHGSITRLTLSSINRPAGISRTT